MNTKTIIIIVLAILSLIMLLTGGVLFGVYRNSDEHPNYKKAGIGLLVTGGVFILITGIVAFAMKGKS